MVTVDSFIGSNGVNTFLSIFQGFCVLASFVVEDITRAYQSIYINCYPALEKAISGTVEHFFGVFEKMQKST